MKPVYSFRKKYHPIGLLIFLLSVVLNSEAKTGFESSVYSFGTLFSGEIGLVTAVFVNEGAADVLIQEVSFSCSCFSTPFRSGICKPGERLNIPVMVDTANRAGPAHQELKMDTSVGRFSTVIEGEALDDLCSTPLMGNIRNLGQDGKTVLFLRSKAAPFSVLRIETKHPELKAVELNPEELAKYVPPNDPMKDVKGIQVWLSTMPNGNVNFISGVKVVTDHPARQTVTFPVRVFMNEFDKVKIVPSHCIVKYPSSKKEVIQKELRLIRTGMDQFEISTFQTSVPGIRVTQKAQEENNAPLLVVEYDPSKLTENKKVLNGNIQIQSSWGDIEIPVTVIQQ